MKVIFLDIDGVLNTAQTLVDIYLEWKKTNIRRIEIDEDKVILLSKIVLATDAKIVLSSSWRYYFYKADNVKAIESKGKELIEIFNKYNLEIYDITGIDKNGIRQNEINEWLKNNDVSSFIVIDDDTKDLKEFINNGLIKTSYAKGDCGLLKEHVEQAINLLNTKEKRLYLF